MIRINAALIDYRDTVREFLSLGWKRTDIVWNFRWSPQSVTNLVENILVLTAVDGVACVLFRFADEVVEVPHLFGVRGSLFHRCFFNSSPVFITGSSTALSGSCVRTPD